MAFKIAGSMAFKEACRRASPKLLEPIMRVEVVVPEEYMGPVIADLNSRRGQLQGRESRAGSEIINVQVPLAEMFGYATDIRSKTQGRGSFTMHFSHYQQAPPNVSEEVIGAGDGQSGQVIVQIQCRQDSYSTLKRRSEERHGEGEIRAE